MINTKNRHLPRDWQWYYDHHQKGFVVWELKTRWCCPSLTTLTKTFLKEQSSTMILIYLSCVVHFVDPSTYYLLKSSPCSCTLIYYIYILLLLCMSWLALIYPCTQHLLSSPCPSSLSGYQYPEVHSWASKLTINTTKPVGSAWYISMSFSQGLSKISIYFIVP